MTLIAKTLAWLVSFGYFFVVAVPVALIVYSLVTIIFFFHDIFKFLKTIKNAKAKFEPKPIERLP